MNIKSKKLEGRLLSYSLAAGAVLVGSTDLSAQVVYTNPADQSNLGQFSIDFNNDATVDIIVRADLGTPSDGVAKSDVRVWGNGRIMGYVRTYTWNFYGSALNSGTEIGPGGNFAASQAQDLVYSYVGQWPGANQKLLGVKFPIGGQTHYGWVRLSCSSTAPYRFTLYDYAYESSADTPINGGALPVELTSFTALVANSGSVKLNWQTATEVNNYGFEILRQEIVESSKSSENQFKKIAFIEGAGNSNSKKEYSFIDNSKLDGKYKYQLKQIDTDGNFKYSDILEVNINAELPSKFELSQNYPNPFNPSTVIRYSLPVRQAGIPRQGGQAANNAQHVTLKIYDTLGNEVATIVNENQPAGNYEITFNGTGLASGIYIYKLSAGNFTSAKKMLMMK